MTSERPLDENSAEKRSGRLLYLAYVQLVVVFVGLVVVGVMKPDWVPWLAIFGAFAVYRSIRVIPQVKRSVPLPEGYRAENVISNGGLDIHTLPPDTSPAETRLAIQDALDAVRRQRYSPRQRLTLRIARGVAILGAVSVTVVASAGAHDPIAAVLSAAVASALGTSQWFTERRLRRAKAAETLLVHQLDMLGPPVGAPALEGPRGRAV